MLRGPQTVGELKQRSERLHRFGSTADVAQTLAGLAQRELAKELDRRPGQKEERWAQLLGGEDEGEGLGAPSTAAAPAAGEGPLSAIEERLARLESRFEELESRLAPP